MRLTQGARAALSREDRRKANLQKTPFILRKIPETDDFSSQDVPGSFIQFPRLFLGTADPFPEVNSEEVAETGTTVPSTISLKA